MRHGETPASRGRTLAGWTDVPLTERGESQAAALRPVFAGEPFEGVWSSDLVRAAVARAGRLAGLSEREIEVIPDLAGKFDGQVRAILHL